MKNQIEIADHRTIKTIQDEFTAMFPWLKLEFFSKPHGVGDVSPKKELINPNEKLEECRRTHTNGQITITPTQSVAELEQSFLKNYGLSVQVFRKSGDVWLETSVTDTWSLEKQNEQGKNMSVKEFPDIN